MLCCLSENSDLNKHFPALTELVALPTLDHIYGQQQPYRADTYWMRYRLKDPANYIAFTRNTILAFPEFTLAVKEHLQRLLDTNIDQSRIHISCIVGTIPPHRDESGRATAVNIGMRNADTAVTYMAKTNKGTQEDFDTFWNTASSVHCQDNATYLLNTQAVHAVAGNLGIKRYMATYGFSQPYENVKRIIR